MLSTTRLRIAIQKSGRLSQSSQILLSQSGIKFHLTKSSLISLAENLPIDLLLVRDDDIPGLVLDGLVDLGIVGENILEETVLSRQNSSANTDYQLLNRLAFGDCRLAIALPKGSVYQGPQSLYHKRIATSYPYLLQRYLQQFDVPYRPCSLSGSVEVAPRAGLADAICDLVSSGATLEANGLQEVAVIYRSQACLIQTAHPIADGKQQLIEKLQLRIQGIIQAKESKYIMLHAPEQQLAQIIDLLPGAEQPTILPLVGEKQRVALHMVSSETLFWDTMEKLKALGASSILVLPIEKMMQ